MEEAKRIEPHKVTKPIQLLAACLVGLIFVNSSFLVAASNISRPEWLPAALVVAAIVNVPIFLASIFLLQTKFRPEMQDDSYYSKYLESKTGYTKREVTAEAIEEIREQLIEFMEVQEEKINLLFDDRRKSLERSPKSLEIDNAIKELEAAILEIESKKPDISWVNKTIAVNQNLDCFADVVAKLDEAGITVHETFGAGIKPPKSFRVAIGGGFSADQVKSLVEAVSKVSDGAIAYAHDEQQQNEFWNRVLVGAYGNEGGITFKNLLALLNKQNLAEFDVYRVLGC